MLYFDTQGRASSPPSTFDRLFKAIAPMPNSLRIGLLAALMWCCLPSGQLFAQCCPISQPQGALINLSLDNTGNVQINPTVFVPYVGSSNSNCLPSNGGIIQLWQDANATVPFANTNYNCAQVGTQVNVFVTLDIPGVCITPPVAPFVVTIVDFVAPVVTGLAGNQTVNATTGACTANVTGLTPSITDNCANSFRLAWVKSDATIGSCSDSPGTYPGTCTTANGSFNVGVTKVTFHVIYKVDDTPLNEDTITLVRTVTVNDNQAPTYDAPGFVQPPSPINANASCLGTPTWGYPTASDNCGVTKYKVKLTYPNSTTQTVDFLMGGMLPTTLPLGTTVVNDTLSDGTPSGTIVHAYNIVVQDVTAPTWTGIPPVLNVGATANCEAAVAMDYSAGTYFNDNCTLDPDIDTTVTVEVITGGPAPYMTRSHTDASATFPDGVYRVIFAATDASGNTGRDTIILTVADNTNPTASCLSNATVYLDADGQYNVDGLLDLDDGSFDNCGIQSDSVRLTPFTAGNPNSNPGNPFLPFVTVTCADIAPGPNDVFVQMKITDPSGNTDACATQINVLDTLPPIAQCKNIMANLSSGTVSVFATDVNNDLPNASYDNCTPAGSLNYRIKKGTGNTGFNAVGVPITFDCTEVGPQTVTLRVGDGFGNPGFCEAIVTVKDVTPPTPMCHPLTVYLDAIGEASVNDQATRTYFATGLPVSIPQPPPTPDMVMHVLNVPTNSTIADVNMSLLINQNLVGDLRATLTSPMGTVVTLFDRPGFPGNPPLGCTNDNLDVKFDDSAFFSASVFENSCNGLPFAIQGTYQSVNPLLAFNGENMMGNWTLTVYDHNNFNAPGAATIQAWSLQITDAVTTNLDLLGLGSTDDCLGNLSWTVVDSLFDCDDLGANIYTLYLTDGSNIDSSCTNTITVVDEIPPTAICKPATLPLDALGNATLLPSMVNDNSTDNCVSNLTYSVSPNTFDCSDIGGFPTVTLSVSDGTHTSTCEATVTVVDIIPPVPACTAISVPLGSNGEVTVLAQQLALASYDACGIAAYEISVDTDNNGTPDSFFDIFTTLDCEYVDDDPVQVSIRVTDGSGNFSICNTTIDVQDNELPILTIPADVTIECDDPQTPDAMNAVGIATATDNTDDCHPVVPTKVDVIPADSYLCDDAYTIVRTWTATDFYGNTVSADQIITVRDFTAPTFTRPSDTLAVECPASTLIANKVGPITVASTNVPVAISASGTPTVSSTLNFTGVGKVLDLNVKNLGITHTFSGDLRVVLTSPSGTSVRLFDQLCSSADVNISFDDQSVSPYSSIPCGPLGGAGTYRSLAPLSIFNGEASNGIWTLTVFDLANLDGGSLDSWSLEITYAQPGTVAQTGDVTNEADNCMPETRQAYFVDYQAYKGFVNHTAPVAYNLTGTPSSSNGSSASANSTTVTLVSDNNGLPIGDATYLLNIPANGYIIFDWDYTTTDLPERDSFGYVLNGVFTQLSDDMGGASQLDNRVVLPVSMGNTFGFAMRSRTGATGAATAVITNFIFTNLAAPAILNMCEHKFSLARFWTMVDDCGNQAPYQVQCITTDDTEKPNIYFPASNTTSAPTATMTVLATGMVCTPYVNLNLTDVYVSDGCSDYSDLTIWNNASILYGIGNGGNDASGYYFPGNYPIRFIVEDECQRRDTLDLTLVVTDDHFPTAICQPSVNINLGNASSVTLPAASVNLGSFDNCPGFDMQVTPNVFTLPGTYNVELVVTDASGNESSCPSVVNVVGANSITFDAGDASGNTGQTVTFPVAVSNFNNVGGFSFTLNVVNGTVAGITPAPGQGSVTGVSSSLTSAGLFSHSATSSTTLNVAWIAVPQTGVNIPNGNIFNVSVVLNGAAGQTTTVTVTNVDVINGAGNSLPGAGIDGTVTVLGTSNFVLSGTLLKEAGCGSTQLSNVTMNVTPSGISTPGSPFTNQSAGSYNFTVPQGSSPTITPVKDINWGNGVDVGDVATVLDHFLGNTLMTSPYNVIAADANADDEIKIGDVFAIYAMITGTPVPGNTSWRFVDPSTFAPPAVTMMNRNTVPAFNESRTVVNAQASASNLNFVGVKVGDVTCGASGSSMGGTPVADVRGGGQLPFRVDHVAARAGEEVVLTFKAQDFNNLLGYQFTLNFDKNDLQFQGFESLKPVELAFAAFSDARVSEGMLATTWFGFDALSMADGEALFVVKFKALNDINAIGDAVHASSDFIQAMAVNAAKDVLDVDLVFEMANAVEDVTEGSRFALLQNRPNPFGHRTVVGFHLPEPTTATLTFTDAAGKVLKVVKGTYATGYHTATIERNDLPTTGVVFYRLDTDKHTAVRKMVLMD